MRFCKKCGERIEPDDKFCSACGARIEESKVVTGASDMSPEEKAQFQQTINMQREAYAYVKQRSEDHAHKAADDAIFIRPEISGENSQRQTSQRNAVGQNPFEKKFESGYYSTSVPPVEPSHKPKIRFVGPNKMLLVVAMCVSLAATCLFAVTFMLRDRGVDDPSDDGPTAVIESKVADTEESTESNVASTEEEETRKKETSNILVNLSVTREAIEPGLAEIGFVIDDSHTSIDDTAAYYFMWDDDDSAFVISFVNNGERFDDFQMYSCSWDMEMRMLELCEKKLGISFDRKDLDEMKAMAEQDSAQTDDHYGFSEYVYAGEYMCSLMVSPYSENDSINEYSLFLEQRYTETAAK